MFRAGARMWTPASSGLLKELNLHYDFGETILITIYTHCGNPTPLNPTHPYITPIFWQFNLSNSNPVLV